MTLPNLVGCGAGKSGTTSLYYYLGQHPQIFMAAAKEVHFFSQYYNKGISWYESHFSNGGNVPVMGEFSTSYMLDTAVPKRMSSLLPQTRLLFIFRNPIDRAYSNYWFALSIGVQKQSKSFSEVIRSQKGFEEYIASGFYYEHLVRFLKYYEPHQIHIMITEDLKQDPLRQMALCYSFLGVDASFQPDINSKYNVTVTTKNRLFASLFSSWVGVKKQVKPLLRHFPGNFRRNLARFEKKVVHQMLSSERPTMSPDDRAYLRELYSPQNEKLASFIGRDMSYWK